MKKKRVDNVYVSKIVFPIYPTYIKMFVTKNDSDLMELLKKDKYSPSSGILETSNLFVIKNDAETHITFCYYYRGSKKIEAIDIFHEAVHIFDFLIDFIGEREIQFNEISAYTMQWIAGQIISELKKFGIKIIV